uniref:HU family DNA-binding protein n=1 Tax=Neisseria sicca TaxID=490 RepID=UPI0011BD0FC5|nr:HU family DNA-binding protein [Neisseria sicca]
MTWSVGGGEGIEMGGFGRLDLNHRAGRIGGKRKSGEGVEVGEKEVGELKPGKELGEGVELGLEENAK